METLNDSLSYCEWFDYDAIDDSIEHQELQQYEDLMRLIVEAIHQEPHYTN